MLRWVPADIPIHRPSVGAMAVTAGSQMPAKIVKPYVYRGTGEDQFPETESFEDRQRRERKRRLEREKREKKHRAERRERNRHRREQEQEAHLARIEAKRAAGWKPGDEGRVALTRIRARQAAEREARRQERLAQAPRPAPGWKPLAGADLDSLLDEISGE